MLQSSGRVKLGSGEAEAEFFEQMARHGVLRMMAGEKGVRAKLFESVGNDRASCLFRKTLAPKFRTKMKT